MMQKSSKALLFGAFLVASTSVFVSCKDYDDDIKNLQTQITANNDVISKLKTAFDGGVVITNVQKDGSGVILSTSDGNEYRITNGTNGSNGADAVVWTIGNDGYWYKDGVKTDYLALGTDGTSGQNGQDGAPGKDADVWTIGDDGYWYKNGVKTETKAVGSDGKNGSDWSIGEDGYWYQDGVKTSYAATNSATVDVWTPGEDGFWYKNGVKQDGTNGTILKKWAMDSSSISVAMTTTGVVFSGVDGEAIFTIPTVHQLSGLVFQPDLYYNGIEATTIKSLEIDTTYTNVKELAKYIDNASTRTETIGTKRTGSKESNITDYKVAGKKGDHELYNIDRTERSIMLYANAKYHVNPITAYLDETTLSILSDDKAYTRGAAAGITVRGNNNAGVHYNKSTGILTVPLNISRTSLLKTVAKDDQVTVFATQATFTVDTEDGKKETTITSDYAAIIKENAKYLRLAHVPYTNGDAQHPYSNPKNLIQTGMLNEHCGDCSLPRHTHNGVTYNRFENKGMHLFSTIDEVKEYIESTTREGNYKGEGQDLINYHKNLCLDDLLEVHYNNEAGDHDCLSDAIFNESFKYRFRLVSMKLGGNETNESSHAALYEEDGKTYLHPQDPEKGGLNGRACDPKDDWSNTTEAVVNRVPVVRVELIAIDLDGADRVVDYGYMPIRITNEIVIETKRMIVDNKNYWSTGDWNVNRFNNCHVVGASNAGVKSTWRNTEEDLFNPLKLDRHTFDYEVYETQGSPADLDQFIVSLDENKDTIFTEAKPAEYFGTIKYEYEPDASGTQTNIFDWQIKSADIQAFAPTNGIVRAVRLNSKKSGYPDIYVIFRTGKISLNDYTVKADAKIKEHIIKSYWYASGTNAPGEGTDEIHTNVITPEENQVGRGTTAWKPTTFQNMFKSVFLNNFNYGYRPNNWIGKATDKPNGWVVYDKSGKQVTDVTVPSIFDGTQLFFDFAFDQWNVDKIFYGYMENSAAPAHFKMSISSDKKSLIARRVNPQNHSQYLDTAPGEVVATINPNPVNDWDEFTAQIVALNYNSEYAKSLLNYKSNLELNVEGVLNTKIALRLFNKQGSGKVEGKLNAGDITCPVDLINYTFDVRFLRPISMDKAKGAVITDAHTVGDGYQKIYLKDLVSNFIEWRGGTWKTSPSYTAYYAPAGKTEIVASVEKVRDGQYISRNEAVKTDITGEVKPLNEVATDLDFKFVEDAVNGDYLEYRNNAATVGTFHVYMPVVIEYYWGKIYDDVTITVNRTPQGARRN